MKNPKLKQPLLCQILVYLPVLGAFILPMIGICCLDFISEDIRAVAVIVLVIGLLVYLFKNFVVLMGLELGLELLHCNLSARTCYTLPRGRSLDAIANRICRFGTACTPSPIQPQPFQLRYRFNSPVTVYTKGIEKVVAAYKADLLDLEQYHSIFRSAKANSQALTNKKKALFLDRAQKKAPLNRVTVVVIFAQKVADQLWDNLYEQVCKQSGDEWEDTMIPCVIDLDKGECVFNSVRLPYIGFAYPAKNRGIRLIKRIVFGGRIPLRDNHNHVTPIEDMDIEKSLWDFWKELAKEAKDSNKKINKRMASMSDGQIILEEDLLYLKLDNRAVCLWVDRDDEKKTAEVESVTHWSYPKANPIGKKTNAEIKSAIIRYFSNQGYTVLFEENNT